MEVSNQSQKELGAAVDPSAELTGAELISRVVDLAGLDPLLVNSELESVMQPEQRENMTLEQLRESLLAYLEQVNEDMNGELGSAEVAE